MLGQLASSLCCHVIFLGAFTLHTPGIRPLCAYKYSEVCELPAALRPKLIVYLISGGGSSGKNYYGFGKGKGGRKGDSIIWEGPLVPDSFPEPVFEFSPQHMSEFTNEAPLRQCDNHRELWPKCRYGEDCLVQMCTDGMDGVRRFFKCPHTWVIHGCFISLSSMRHLT